MNTIRIPNYVIGIFMLLGWGLALMMVIFPQVLTPRNKEVPDADVFAKEVLKNAVYEYDSIMRENQALIRDLDRMEFELEYEKRRFEDFQEFVRKAGTSGSRTVTQYLQVSKNRKWDPVNKVWITD